MKDGIGRVLLAGTHKLREGIAGCLTRAGHRVSQPGTERMDQGGDYSIAIVVCGESLEEKSVWIRTLEDLLPSDTLIAVNTESIPLSALQRDAAHPSRIIGLNWSEPADTTFFLEIITNEINTKTAVSDLYALAKKHWRKDPYVLRCGYGIRSRMMAAMFREAAYLVENGYASFEDVDRACRNDAGFYLPFAGNFRYMDLMGTYAYGMVMKDLNPELSNAPGLPEFFDQAITRGSGMESGSGFYTYAPGEPEEWQNTFEGFSLQIQQMIRKYAFQPLTEPV